MTTLHELVPEETALRFSQPRCGHLRRTNPATSTATGYTVIPFHVGRPGRMRRQVSLTKAAIVVGLTLTIHLEAGISVQVTICCLNGIASAHQRYLPAQPTWNGMTVLLGKCERELSESPKVRESESQPFFAFFSNQLALFCLSLLCLSRNLMHIANYTFVSICVDSPNDGLRWVNFDFNCKFATSNLGVKRAFLCYTPLVQKDQRQLIFGCRR
jgi:hypothetical protein